MTEEAVRAQLDAQFGAEAVAQLERFAALVAAENDVQNLVARSTVPTMWRRHILDSAQLLPLAPVEGTWIDIGSGGGLPGIVIAICRPAPIVLVEPRRLRAEFLGRVVRELGLTNASVVQSKIEAVTEPHASVISARAVASLDRLLTISSHLATPSTRWLLPKGASAETEVAEAKRAWHGTFHVERSATDPSSGIVVAREVRRR